MRKLYEYQGRHVCINIILLPGRAWLNYIWKIYSSFMNILSNIGCSYTSAQITDIYRMLKADFFYHNHEYNLLLK